MVLLFFALVVCSAQEISAQTTEFTFQGSLKDGASAANGNYDFEFALFDTVAAGNQIGATVPRNGIAVANGIFSVKLDFGSAFPGANRFLEIRVRLSGQPGITTLGPRQLVNSAPYAVKAINADNTAQLGGVAANQYVTTANGGANFIQNTTSPQASSNFNISGSGVVGGAFSAAGNVGIGTSSPQKKLHVFGEDIRVEGSSSSITPRFSLFNTGGVPFNVSNIGKWQNYAGYGALFGNLRFSALNDAENQETIWLNVVRNPGISIRRVEFPSGDVQIGNNLVVGTTGVDPVSKLDIRGTVSVGLTSVPGFPATNSIFINNDSGESANTFRLDADSNGIYMIGRSGVGASQGTSLGFRTGVAGTGEFERMKIAANGNVGIGTTAPSYRLEVVDVSNAGLRVQTDLAGGSVASFGGVGSFYVDAPFIPGGRLTILENGNIGINDNNPTNKLSVAGTIAIGSLGSAGTDTLCRNGFLQISTCSSSLRYKTNVSGFTSGLAFVNKLRPITFEWKEGGKKDVGFGAEDVAKIDPRFVTYNDKGDVEGVKYDRLSVAFVNAFSEQQTQIEILQQQIKEQKAEIEAFKELVCSQNPAAKICLPKR